MPTRPLSTERAERRRQELLQAAIEAFGAHDYDAVSMDNVAAAAGASHGLAFQYFGSKKGLYVAALEFVIARFREHILGAPSSGSAAERLYASLTAYVDWAAHSPAGYRSLMGPAMALRETRQRVEGIRQEGIRVLAASFGLDLGASRTRIVLRAWIGFNEAAILAWLDEGCPDRDGLVALMVRSLLDTVAALTATASEHGG